ncbi:MAG: hypothetical protein Q8K32_07070 [Archangium sp.]|nr:hypothetical protein [Archangium sp.]
MAERAMRDRGEEWGINAWYDSNKINLLVPSAQSAQWPASCGRAPTFPSCWSYPVYNQIICNRAMARHITRQMNSVNNIELAEQFATRFVFFLILGHELSHVRNRDTKGISHFLPDWKRAHLTCRSGETAINRVEARADEEGSSLACKAVRASGLVGLENANPYSAPFAVKLIGLLNEGFVGDDVCLGDIDYPSFTRRALAFLAAADHCVDPEGLVPQNLSDQQTPAFEAYESELRSHQLRGFAAFEGFGERWVTDQKAYLEPGGRVATSFVSDRTRSTISYVQLRDNRGPFAFDIWTFEEEGRVVGTRRIGSAREWLIETGRNGIVQRLHRVTTVCNERLRTCSAAAERPFPAASMTLMLHASGELLDFGPLQLRFYRSIDAVRRGDARIPTGKLPVWEWPVVSHLAMGPLSVSAASRSQGEHVFDVATPLGRRAVSLPFPQDFDIRALHVDEDRLLLFLGREYQEDRTAKLWDCPLGILNAESSGPHTCRVHDAPPQLLALDPFVVRTLDLFTFVDPGIEAGRDGCSEQYVAITTNDRLWVVNRANDQSMVVPAQGLAGCTATGDLVTFRAGRVDIVAPNWGKGAAATVTLGLGTAQ